MKVWLFLSILGIGALACKMAFADPSVYDSWNHGRKTVASAGTAEQITTTSTAVKECVICAEDSNTGTMSVGSLGVVATEATRTGIYLQTADCTVTRVNDLSEIYVNATVAGDGVTYVYYQ